MDLIRETGNLYPDEHVDSLISSKIKLNKSQVNQLKKKSLENESLIITSKL